MDEVAFAELVFDELVGGARIRHAQQRLGQHHQRQSLFGRQREFAKHVFDAAEPVVVGPDRLDQAGGEVVDPLLLRGAQARRLQERSRHGAIVGRESRGKGGRGGRIRRHGVRSGPGVLARNGPWHDKQRLETTFYTQVPVRKSGLRSCGMRVVEMRFWDAPVALNLDVFG